MKYILAIALASAACLDAQLVPCGDKLCPVGAVCVADELCATPEQIDACAGLADGESCALRGGVGLCDRGACVGASCGDGIVDPGEECDDANTTSGDGCRADCAKIERCGDGTVDQGESCDDGNSNPADGCDACVTTAWTAAVTIGGSLDGTAVALGDPEAVAVDRSGNLFIADRDNRRVRRLDPSGVITTIAGTGRSGFSGDGGLATSADLFDPEGIAVDGLGNVLIADGNHVRRIDPNGTITTLAGSSTAGFAGDGGPASSAQLSRPRGIAVDGLGNVYIADSGNHRIRRIDSTGTITTVAGTGVAGYAGDDGPATSALLSNPMDVEVDPAGELLIADAANYVVRRVALDGTITTAAAICGWTVASDDSGNVYVGGCQTLARVDANGSITQLAGGAGGFAGDGGPAAAAQFLYNYGLDVDAAGNLYIADSGNNRIRRIAAGVINTIAGNDLAGFAGDGGAALSAPLAAPQGVAIDAQGNVYIADAEGSRVRRVDVSGTITTFAGTFDGYGGDGGPASSAQLSYPVSVALDGAGNVYISDYNERRIRHVDPNGTISTLVGTGTSGFSGDGGPASSAAIAAPYQVTVDGAGNVYVADAGNHRIRRVDAAGIITTVAGTGSPGFSGDGGPATSAQLNGPSGVAIDAAGNLLIADYYNGRIRRVDAGGTITTIAGTGSPGSSGDGGAATAAQIGTPYMLSASGGMLYITQANYNVVRRIDGTGVITTIAGTGTTAFTGDGGPATAAELDTPCQVASDANGNVYIADAFNHAVRHIEPTGRITTIAGAVDPEGMGPLGRARLVDARAITRGAGLVFIAGGTSGTVQAARATTLGVVAGRYQADSITASLARFRGRAFGSVGGVAFDAAQNRIFISETSAHRIDVVTIVDVEDAATWTIAPFANVAGQPGVADGAVATARFREPTGVYFDAATRQLYVADTGNHAVRVIDLATATVGTFAGTPATRGLFGDGGLATQALLYAPEAITVCGGGDVFVADTGNHRVRRVAVDGTISTVLGVGVAASSGEGVPATAFPVNAPRGLGCDALGNLFVSSTTAVRLLAADSAGTVDGSGPVQTIYGAAPRDTFPASVTRCLTGLELVDASTVEIADSCSGLLVQLHRAPE